VSRLSNADSSGFPSSRVEKSAAHTTDGESARDVEKFVRTHYLDVYRYLYHKLPSAPDAQDATQETFLKYVSTVSADELDTKGRAYLFTIARNVSNDFYRYRPPTPTHLTPELEETLMAKDDIPGDDGFGEAVAGLDEDLREILSLKYSQGFGVNEIATITGITRFSVRRKLKRALSELGKPSRDSWKESDHE
jgi:RNA polymerase sigma-70 factor (ECF subfamily)